jgi:hypothetical protein
MLLSRPTVKYGELQWYPVHGRSHKKWAYLGHHILINYYYYYY